MTTTAQVPLLAPEEPTGLSFKIPIRTVSRSNLREHWYQLARRDKEQKLLVQARLGTRVRGMFPCAVTFTRIAPYALDDDNLSGAFKAIRDMTAVCLGLPVTKQGLANDRDPRVSWHYRQRRGSVREYAIKIHIEPTEESNGGAAS